MTPIDRYRRFAAATLLALLTMLVGQRPAYADTSPTSRVAVVSQGVGSARLVFTAVGLPSGATVDVTSAQVELDGKPTRAFATLAGKSVSAGIERRAVLVFDTSGSMAGAGIAGARAAALAFIASVPADVKVGLVAFSDRPRVVLAPSLSRRALTSAVDRLQAGGETALYDGVGLSLHLIGTTGERAIVVLSDGADTRSRDSLSTVNGQLKHSGVRMDAVALHTADSVRTSLLRMANATGGRVTPAANAADLAKAFSAAARTFASDLVLSIAVPNADRGRAVALSVTVNSSVGPLHAAASLQAVGAPIMTPRLAERAPAPATPHGTPASLLVLVFVALFVPLLALLITLELRSAPRERTKRLLNRYTLRRLDSAPLQGPESMTALKRLAARLMAVSERVASNPARRDRLDTRLTRADVSLTPGEWIAVKALVSFSSGALGTLLFGSLAVGLVLAVGGFAASAAWLSVKGRRRLRAFDERLPSALQLVASSLRSGFSLAQALDGVVREGVEPIAGEFNRALSESRLGMPLEDALDGISDRMASTDWSWVVMAIRIQREVGGNLAEILLTTAGVMRERARLRRQVKALSAEGRLSAYVLLALPIGMALYMFAVRRAYIRPLYTTGFGIAMLAFAVVSLVIGMLWMRKVVTVEV